MKTPYEDLKKSTSATANDRFNAYLRLKKLNESSMLSITCASLSLIVVSLLTITKLSSISIPADINDLITLVQNLTPIIILVLSLIISNNNYGARSEKMHDCARKINSIDRTIGTKLFKNIPIDDDYEVIKLNYEAILDSYENHEKIDRTIRRIEKHLENHPKTDKFLWPLARPILNAGFTNYFFHGITLSSVIWPTYVIYKSISGNPC